MCFDAFAEGKPREQVIDLATRALAGGDLPTDPVSGGHAFVSAAIGLMFAERYEDAERLYSGALEDARKRGSGVSFATAASLRSLVNYRRGRLSDAEADARAALNLAGEVHGSQGFLSAALGTLIYTSLDRGTVDAELERFADTFLVEQATDNLPYSHAIHSRACLRVQAGDLQRGLEELLASGRRELEWGAPNPAITPWRSAAALVQRRSSATATRRGGWRRRRWRSREPSARRAAWASRCGRPAWSRAGRSGSRCCARRSRCSRAPTATLELARALIDLGAAVRVAGDKCRGARAARPRPGAGSAAAARPRWPSGRATSCAPPAPARAAPR